MKYQSVTLAYKLLLRRIKLQSLVFPTMDEDSSVSDLQEFCSKSKNGPPQYNYIDNQDGDFICKVNLLEVEAFGNGRSKRDARHLAEVNIMRKMRKTTGCINQMNITDTTEDFDELTNLNRDMLKELRNYCVRHEMPLPTIEIVQESPEYVASCTVASITRYGKSDKKKDARQRAAIEMLLVIAKDGCGVPSQDTSTPEDDEAHRRMIFSSYRELTESGPKEFNGVRLRDRHNYFKKFHASLKSDALKILDASSDGDYSNDKDRVMSLLSALKIKSRINILPSLSMKPLIQLELLCDYDAVFIGFETEIYNQILQYFRSMLN